MLQSYRPELIPTTAHLIHDDDKRKTDDDKKKKDGDKRKMDDDKGKKMMIIRIKVRSTKF